MTRRLLIAGAALIALSVTGVAVVLIVDASLPDPAALARRVPVPTALMEQRLREARAAGRAPRLERRWVDYDRISPLLRRAVLIAEDDAFYQHGGLDWDEIRASMKRNLAAGRVVRGGSTITQQLARNLYLGNQRTLTRKLREILLARRIEGVLSKRRIFELYLNLIEWGDGVYGIEAAARRHFGVAAADLDARQSALLAAVIINPRRYDPAHPQQRIERRARMILGRMRKRGQLSEAEYRAAIGLQPPAPAGPGAAPGTLVDPAASDSGAGGEGSDGHPSATEPDSAPAPADTLGR